MPSAREYPSRPLVGVGVLIHEKGKVLLVRRRNPPNQGRWALPGGLVELGESVKAAVAREVKEELGIRVELERLIDVIDSVHLDGSGRVQYHYVLVDYLAKPLTRKVNLDPESYAYGWFSPQETTKMNVTKSTAEIIGKVGRLIGPSRHSRH